MDHADTISRNLLKAGGVAASALLMTTANSSLRAFAQEKTAVDTSAVVAEAGNGNQTQDIGLVVALWADKFSALGPRAGQGPGRKA